MRVLTLGTFDLLHVGHLNLFVRSRRHASRLTVGVNTDRFVVEYKGVRPVIGEQDRLRMVRALRPVDDATLNDGPGVDLIRTIQPDIITIGSDWHQRDYLGQLGISQEEIDELGIGILYLPRTPGISTTQLRNGL